VIAVGAVGKTIPRIVFWSSLPLKLRVLSTVIPFSRSEGDQKTVWGTVFLTNTSNPAVPYIDAKLLQFLGHSWAATLGTFPA